MVSFQLKIYECEDMNWILTTPNVWHHRKYETSDPKYKQLIFKGAMIHMCITIEMPPPSLSTSPSPPKKNQTEKNIHILSF